MTYVLHADIKERRNLILQARAYTVDIAKLERLVDQAHASLAQYGNFIHTFRTRYPNAYEDIVLETKFKP